LLQDDVFLKALHEWMETSMHRSLTAFIRHNRESDLSFSQVNTLFRLYHHGPSSVNALAEHLGITKAAVSQLLDPLITAGLVVRSENPEDRRRKLIDLTDKGHELVKQGMRTRHAWMADLVKEFSDEEKERILPALQLLTERTRVLYGEHDWPWRHHHPGFHHHP
jgi:DNA-binding MarR family transcriptional regulator